MNMYDCVFENSKERQETKRGRQRQSRKTTVNATGRQTRVLNWTIRFVGPFTVKSNATPLENRKRGTV